MKFRKYKIEISYPKDLHMPVSGAITIPYKSK